jgi:hypothetical protein
MEQEYFKRREEEHAFLLLLESAPPTHPPGVAVADVGKALPATQREARKEGGGGGATANDNKKPGLLKNVSRNTDCLQKQRNSVCLNRAGPPIAVDRWQHAPSVPCVLSPP